MSAVDVSVCVCTCRRPEGLLRCLASIEAAQRPPGLAFEVVVVDNDARPSAEAAARRFAAGSALALRYVHEARSGVSFARNRCLAEARGALVAFIDDDEWCDTRWLVQLHAAMTGAGAPDVVLGPVKPVFEREPPRWLAASRVFQRPSFANGAAVHWGNGRTGNAMLRRADALACGGFDDRFAHSGGEDLHLFARLARNGHARFVWADDALVCETVPPSRSTLRWVLARAFAGSATMVRVQVELDGPGRYWWWGVRGLLGAPFNAAVALLALPFSRRAAFARVCRCVADLGKLTAAFVPRVGSYGRLISPPAPQ